MRNLPATDNGKENKVHVYETRETISKSSEETTMIDRAKLLDRVMDIEKKLNGIQDYDILLDQLLTEARLLTNADAGSIYEYTGDMLEIKHAQNETQQSTLAPGEKLPFVHTAFPMDFKSVAGYCIITGKTVTLPDVYNIPPDAPYSFNRFLDIKTGYHTVSTLTVPMFTLSRRRPLGALQIINPKDAQGNIDYFSEDKQTLIEHFAAVAAAALERAFLTRSMLLRMIEMARFRDPTETNHHVNRVSHYALEIYDRWAFLHHESEAKAIKFRDNLKIAAMMHDVGKVGIPDHILKKQDRLTDEEYALIRCHTCIGASLFVDPNSDVDQMVQEVAMHHHERWDGAGYPGSLDPRDAAEPDLCERISQNPGLQGNEIPLAARIVGIADVFDALSSARSYKQAWSADESVAEIIAQRGKQFDPGLVDCFEATLPRILAIKEVMQD
jgi:HD-GYP domain-containing protein (c-di-GMP phosphodiesterase class II)